MLIIINVLVVIILIFLFILLSMVWPPDSPWSPWWRTNKKTARKICRLAQISSKDIIYDLGCGDGSFIIVASKEYGARCVGIEIDPVRFLITKIRVSFNNLSTKISVRKKNFFNEKLSGATVVSMYLVPRVLKKITPKLVKELRPNAKIISYKYKMELPIIKYDQKNEIYIHRTKNE